MTATAACCADVRRPRASPSSAPSSRSARWTPLLTTMFSTTTTSCEGVVKGNNLDFILSCPA
jgi:hypothetical protein